MCEGGCATDYGYVCEGGCATDYRCVCVCVRGNAVSQKRKHWISNLEKKAEELQQTNNRLQVRGGCTTDYRYVCV